MHYTHGKPFCLSLVPQLVLALPSLTVVDHAPCSAHALQTLSARPSAEQHTRHPSWMLQSEMLSASTLAGAPRRGELFRRSPGSVIGTIPPTHNKITDDLMTVLRAGRSDRIKLWKCCAPRRFVVRTITVPELNVQHSTIPLYKLAANPHDTLSTVPVSTPLSVSISTADTQLERPLLSL